MVNINISLTEEAYNYLKSLKGGDKSFSDVVLEFKENKCSDYSAKGLLKFAGVLRDKEVDWGAKEKRMRELRESFNKRLSKR